jgi:hypothetical protein
MSVKYTVRTTNIRKQAGHESAEANNLDSNKENAYCVGNDSKWNAFSLSSKPVLSETVLVFM